jgi:hypothetical protein
MEFDFLWGHQTVRFRNLLASASTSPSVGPERFKMATLAVPGSAKGDHIVRSITPPTVIRSHRRPMHLLARRFIAQLPLGGCLNS